MLKGASEGEEHDARRLRKIRKMEKKIQRYKEALTGKLSSNIEFRLVILIFFPHVAGYFECFVPQHSKMSL